MKEYEIVEERHVTNEIQSAQKKYRRFHDLYDALTWRLARDPSPKEAEEFAPETFLMKSERWESLDCQIMLFYTFDNVNKRITILDIFVDSIS